MTINEKSDNTLHAQYLLRGYGNVEKYSTAYNDDHDDDNSEL